MASNASDSIFASALGISVSVNRDVSGDGGVVKTPTVPRAKIGTLTTRTDNDTGVITAETGHGIISTNKVDVYFEDGKRVQMVATVAGDLITVDGGTGDNLPALDSDVTFMKPQVEDFAFDGDNMIYLIANADARATIRIMDDVPGLAKQIDIESSSDGYVWNSSSGEANPLVGDDILTVEMSHEDGVNARDVRCGAVTV